MDLENRLLLRVEEAAEVLGIGRTMMFALIKKGEILSIKIGRSTRVRPSDLKAWADKADAEVRKNYLRKLRAS